MFVLALVAGVFSVARLPSASAEDRSTLASRYAFTELPIALPPGLPERTVRQVNPRYEHIRSWVSSVGAGVALNDLDGKGGANDLCLVDSRSDAAIVTRPRTAALPTRRSCWTRPRCRWVRRSPRWGAPGRLQPRRPAGPVGLLLGPDAGVVPATARVTALSLAAYHPIEVIPQRTVGDVYRGPLWNTNAVAVADFDGDGRPDVGIFNYFPDSQVLDPQGLPHVQMNHSMSHARNAGGAHPALDRRDHW
ncbi:VCBS repeat-containing protein [Micromonospora sp. M12]